MTRDVLKYLQPNAAIPIDMETTSLLVNALKKALAEHAMQEVQRLGQEIEPDDIASIIACRDMLDAQPVPPQRKPLTKAQIDNLLGPFPKYASEWDSKDLYEFTRAIEAAHGIKENT